MNVLAALTILALAGAAYASCDGVSVDDRCFYADEIGGATVEGAESFCAGGGGELAEILTMKEYDQVYFYLLGKYPSQMVLTGLKYKHTKNGGTHPLTKSGEVVSYKPNWFEGHPIKREGHGDIVIVTNKSSKFSGYMNTADNSRYSTVLCSARR